MRNEGPFRLAKGADLPVTAASETKRLQFVYRPQFGGVLGESSDHILEIGCQLRILESIVDVWSYDATLYREIPLFVGLVGRQAKEKQKDSGWGCNPKSIVRPFRRGQI